MAVRKRLAEVLSRPRGRLGHAYQSKNLTAVRRETEQDKINPTSPNVAGCVRGEQSKAMPQA